MDVPDDAGVDAEGPLDPRIQIELENLNNATDEINKLEIELDEAHTAFRQLSSESTRRLTEIANKIGRSCIEKAKCYYKALEVARQAQVQCQRQTQLFQRANEIHAAAKETVALAETRFISHQHEVNFDQAWQDMLNHATIKVMDAENQKAECGREHLKCATLFHDAEKKVQNLEEKHRRAIIKSRPYFEVRAQCDEMLATQKSRVEYLQKRVKKAKDSYATSLRVLENISNQIHQRRREYDIMTKGPREPGVGAELQSPTESLSYEAELDKLSLSRINSIASSEPDLEERHRDFEDVDELKYRMEQLSARSVDGSESTSSQWELELQASVERLNTLPIRKLNSSTTEAIINDSPSHECNEIGSVKSETCETQRDASVRDFGAIECKVKQNDENESKKLNEPLVNVKKRPLSRTGITWYSTSPSSSKSGIIHSETFSTSGFSKSLDNSLVNIGNIIFQKESGSGQEVDNCQASGSRSIGTGNFVEDIVIDVKKSDENWEHMNKDGVKKKISVDTVNLEIAEFVGTTINNEQFSKGDEIRNENTTHDKMERKHNQRFKGSTSNIAKHRMLAKSRMAKSYENNLDKDFVMCLKAEKQSSQASSVKELPLLSIIHRFPESRFSKDRSSSMTDLAEKKDPKTYTNRSDS
ncbi:SH3 domain-binding protein 5 homolog [Athalia rosae]|uniref:SH3 domain-binding protein 5 homolog n=1 Tax=Athalia rosae TaxID=37344 RepID=UPI0020332191|nr:SH3 domain-binding protein 5 homolog [Athalia rosae]